ncbi:MAG: hypothetical protein ACJ8CR_08015, partial [Roseiflexaceae bacterium]
NVYQDCTTIPMERSRFLKYEATLPKRAERKTPTYMKGPLGATYMDIYQTVVPEIATTTIQQGAKTFFKLKPTHAEMAPIKSAFTAEGEFAENDRPWVKEECQDALRTIYRRTGQKRFPIFWRITKEAAALLEAGEREHCLDYRAAFNATLVLYASVINNVAAAERTYSTEKQATEDAARQLRAIGVQPGNMLASYSQLAARTVLRDSQDWHSATSQSFDPPQNGCKGFLEIYDQSSLPNVRKTSPEALMQGTMPQLGAAPKSNPGGKP